MQYYKKTSVRLLAAVLCLMTGCIQIVVPEGYEMTPAEKIAATSSQTPPPKRHPGRNGPLTEAEMKLAKVAWKYFENNYQPKTGLVNAVNQYPSTTMWDTGSYLGGLTAAYELGLITKNEFDIRLTTILNTFNTMNFFRNELPNKAYHTRSAKKVNYTNKPGEIGYSALDLGRLLIWLRIIRERYPHHGNAIDQFVLRWNFRRVINKYGMMYGAILKNNKPMYVQEGRLGYEEYAAKGFQLWGFDTEMASKPEPYAVVPIFGVDVPYDTRDPRELVAHNYVVCESYVLDGMEMNWDLVSDTDSNDLEHSDEISVDFAQRIYQVQENRFRETGIFTARTEHQLDRAPYFVYDTIYTDGYPWNTITEKGDYVPKFSAVALKGAFGLWSLWETGYTDLLFDLISGLYDPEKGFYEGRYERSGGLIKTFTANNNGIILESLLHKVQGKLLKPSGKPGLWEQKIQDEFIGTRRGYPGHRDDL
ncbi:DUF3131 domain-containing protein [Desulfonema ishimotonii]|uniref:DUF3131 domain-containing protein n=1 Tax=Desulfonema ishimotonii TaxID=45657 RepID=A0A401FUL4_9BACT|nr:DUF3131 domain-containing protein [Desulfonema ishimotonii]GBC60643.1 DUF3131 domain-containing protein [Desulfonema ishimotonii]